MTCIACDKEINNLNDICVTCKFDPHIMISRTDAKRKYKLTDKEIKAEDLFCITFRIHGNIGTKYLISDIENLAHCLYLNLDNADKRKQAYLKQLAIMNDIRAKQDRAKNKIAERTLNVYNLLAETDIDITVEIKQLIDEYCLTNSTAGKIVNKIKKFHRDKLAESKRKIKLDKLIDEHVPDKYIKLAYKNPAYISYVKTNDLTIDEAYDQIYAVVQEKIDREARKKELDTILKKKIPKKFMQFASCTIAYRNYVELHIETLDETCNLIEKLIKCEIGKDAREETISKLCVDLNICGESQTMYQKFIDNGGDINSTMAKIKSSIEKQIKVTKLNKLLRQNKIQRPAISFVADQYIMGKIPYTDVDIAIKSIIQKRIRINKINNLLGTHQIKKTSVINIYSQYVNGQITYEDVRKQLQYKPTLKNQNRVKKINDLCSKKQIKKKIYTVNLY